MLFDTHSPHRRRGVQIVFGLLAVLMAVGYVGFNVGGEGQGGGLAEGLMNQQSGLTDAAKADIKAAEKVLATDPGNNEALARMARGRLGMANAVAFDPQTGAPREDGQPLIDQAKRAWLNYLENGPKEPNASVAIQFATFFAQPGVSDYRNALRAMEAVLLSREPSAGLYSQMAVYAMAVQDKDKAKEARKRALELAGTPERRKQITRDLDQIQKSIDQQVKQFEEQNQAADRGEAERPSKLQPTLPALQ